MRISRARHSPVAWRAVGGSWRVGLAALALALAGIAAPLADYLGLYLDNPVRPPARSRATLTVLGKMAAAVPEYYRHAVGGGPEVVELAVAVRPDHLRRMSEQRAEALRVGVLFASRRDLVPATVRVGDREVAARVRLKGDLSDHWSRGRWSLRLEVKDGDRVLGLRRFSLHPPWARGFHREPMFFDWLRAEGLLAPRTSFVDFTLNGRHLGLMELEEHFAAELLAFHRRPPGLLFKLDESRLWQEWVASAQRLGVRWSISVPKPLAADDWRQARVDPFEARAVRASPSRSRDLDQITRRLAQVGDGELAPSVVFDSAPWGQSLAHCEIFGAPHMALWNNLRFYLHPDTERLEPVAFDSDVTPRRQHRPRGDVVGFSCLGGDLELTTTLVADPVIRAAFLEAIRHLDRKLHEPAAEAFFSEREARYLPVLRTEYPWLEPFDLAAARRRATARRAVSEEGFWQHVQPPR